MAKVFLICGKLCSGKTTYAKQLQTAILLKKLNRILNIIIGAFIGVFIGHGIYVFWDFKAHPDLYAMQSAPWYTSILLYGIVTAVVLIAAVIIKLIIRQKLKKEYHNG